MVQSIRRISPAVGLVAFMAAYLVAVAVAEALPVDRPAISPTALVGARGSGPHHDSVRIPGRYIVVFEDSVDHPGAVAEAQTDAQDGQLGLIYRTGLKGYAAGLSNAAVKALRQKPTVKYVIPDYKVEALGQMVPTGIQRTFDTENETAAIDGTDTRVNADVAVIDTGIDESHPDLNLYRRTNCVPNGADGALESPFDVAIDAESNVWVADAGHDSIDKFDTVGKYISQIGSSGSEPGQFNTPNGVATDSEGNVWVADTGNNRIQVFSPTGKFVRAFGSKGSEPGQFQNPRALATDSEGNVWVADTENNRIQKLTPQGKVLMTMGGTIGSEPGQFHEPSGIAIDAEGRIWVADSRNRRVEVFKSEGKFLFQFGESGSGNGQFIKPRGIAFDNAGNAWISDQDNYHVQEFDPKGKYLAKFGEFGSGPGQFGSIISGPLGLAIDSEDSIFVANPENERVEKWSHGPPPTYSLSFGYPGCMDGTGTDGAGHGTHVAGTIGALDNGEGVVGIAPGVRLWSVRVLNDEGSGDFSWIIAGIDWVTAHASEIEVANMSLGGYYPGGPDPISEAIESSIEAGVVYAVAAGNEGEDAASFTPAKTAGAITVAAQADYDGKPGGEGAYTCRSDVGVDDTLATFSNYGEGVDIAAPGVCVYSTLPMAGAPEGKEYGSLSGTSMASPHVAGAAALLASKSNPNSRKDVESIRNQLVEGGSLSFDHTASGPPAPLLYLGAKALTGTEVSIGGASSVGAQGGNLSGAINPRGRETTYQFEYGLDTSYGHVLPASPKTLAAGAGFTRVSETLAGLESNTTYHYRLVASNSEGTFKTKDHSFKTLAVSFTNAQTNVSETGATLNGLVYQKEWPEGTQTTYSFDYGLTASYGQSIIASVDETKSEENQSWNSWSYTPVIAKLSSLSKGTVYHFRVVATNSFGTFRGEDQQFRTAVWSKWGLKEPDRMRSEVACATSDFCVALGGPYGDWMKWDGKSWVSYGNGSAPEGWNSDVSCVSKTFCIAVGSTTEDRSSRLRAMQWDGNKWTATAEPPLPSEAIGGWLNAVTCTSSSSCIAVGEYFLKQPPGESVPDEYLSERWDGSKWTLLPMPDAPSTSPMLTDVACATVSTCFAGGERETLQWDGSEWSKVAGAPLRMTSLSCSSASSCVAVNGYGERGATWNGSAWTTMPMKLLGKLGSTPYLEDVSCAAPWSCEAVGWYSTAWGYVRHALSVHWDGQEWSSDSVPFPEAEVDGKLLGVACTSTSHCVGVGMEGDFGALFETYDYPISAPTATTNPAIQIGRETATLRGTVGSGSLPTTYQFEYDTSPYKAGESSHGTKAPLSPKGLGSSSVGVDASEPLEGLKPATTYHYRVIASNAEGTVYGEDQSFTTWASWSTQTTVNPAPLTKASLESVSCASSSMCFAVGSDGAGTKNLVHRWTGSEWKSMASKEGTLSDVSCPSTTACNTVGEAKTGTPGSEWWVSAGGTWLSGTKSVATPGGGSAVRLKDVSCSSATACTAVGSYYNGTRTVTLAERSTSETGGWSVQTTANPESGDAELLGVSCDSASSCTAVGWQGSKTFAERWNGTSWSTVSTPNPSPSVESVLRKVSCTSSTSCMAVGYYREGSSGTANNKKTLAERWNGTSWSIVSSPNPVEAKGTSLLDVSCASSSSCIAVGRYASATPKGLEYESVATEEKTLVESWGGSEWQIQSSPNPEGKKFSKLAGVSCSASNACAAVGSGIQGEETTTLGEAWNGTSWSTQTTVNPAPLTKASLESVSCASSSMCFAVGSDGAGTKNLVHRWTGSEWKSMASKEGTLSDVSCPSTTACNTVGEAKTGTPGSEWWVSAGGTWLSGTKSVATPGGGSAVRLKDVSCSSATACTAVGSYYNGTRTVTLAERSTSETGGWSVQTTANPESGDAELLGVSCDSASSCTAVGWQGSKTFAERWNGTSWSTVSTPNPSPSVESVLRKVSCTSSTSCMAVGYYREGSSGTANNKKTLAERWNGTSWSIVSSPNPVEAKGTSLLDVSCASSSSCIAVGRYASATPKGLEYESVATEEKTLVESWGGSEWQIQSSPNPEGKKFSKLAGVSCSASNACAAVGSGIQGEETTTLGEQYK